MKMLRLTLLMVGATLVIPALSQAGDCYYICRDEYIGCIESSCPGGSFCSECDGVFMSCMDWCENQPPSCIPPGGIDDTLYETHCCSDQAVPGSTTCTNPADYGTTWESCTHTCA
jgi:hypothetical protein